MLQDFLIVDDFLPDPDSIRKTFTELEFYDMRGPDGEMYKRINVRNPQEFNGLLAKAVGKPVVQDYSLVRLNYAGEPPNNAIHSDGGYSDFAAVLYMCKPEDCQGGTAFWRHKATNFTALPTEEQVRKVGKKPSQVWEKISKSWNTPDAWQRMGTAEMKFNRIIIYPTKNFHSRWPFEAFGSTPQDGRLIWVSFFKV